jgi:hypothetical protein
VNRRTLIVIGITSILVGFISLIFSEVTGELEQALAVDSRMLHAGAVLVAVICFVAAYHSKR